MNTQCYRVSRVRLAANAYLLLILMLGGCSERTSDHAEYSNSATRSTASAQSWKVPESLEPVTVEFEYLASSPPGAAGIFTDLDPSETGIDLHHVWDPPAIHRSLVSQIFGSGVAFGDYDNDGLLDVFVARQTDAGRLYRNLGNMKFADVTTKVGIDPIGMWTFGTTFVDLNNDGLLDLYLCGQDCPNRLYINTGNGFNEQAAEYGLDFSGASIQMKFADYDLDGDLDAYLVTNHLNRKRPGAPNEPMIEKDANGKLQVRPEFREFIYLIEHPDGCVARIRAGQSDHLYRNDDGSFVDVTDKSGVGFQPYIGLSANWWDYNEDGLPDLYVASDYKGSGFPVSK